DITFAKEKLLLGCLQFTLLLQDQSSSGNQGPRKRAAALAENLLCLLLFILGTKRKS
ncbi:unnamed protein product, partial [Arabidopsis halleri]